MPLIFRPGPAATAFTAAVAAWLVFEFVMRARQRRQAGGPASADPTFSVLIACLAAAVAAAEMLGRDGRLPWPGGLAMARRGRDRTDHRRDRAARLVDRHAGPLLPVPDHHPARPPGGDHRALSVPPPPAYTAIALILAGIALACDVVWSMAAAAALGGAGLAVRIRAEERQLTQALGAGYQRFAAGRKRLVPGVW